MLQFLPHPVIIGVLFPTVSGGGLDILNQKKLGLDEFVDFYLIALGSVD
jgi:hypothetical protein